MTDRFCENLTQGKYIEEGIVNEHFAESDHQKTGSDYALAFESRTGLQNILAHSRQGEQEGVEQEPGYYLEQHQVPQQSSLEVRHDFERLIADVAGKFDSAPICRLF